MCVFVLGSILADAVSDAVYSGPHSATHGHDCRLRRLGLEAAWYVEATNRNPCDHVLANKPTL